MTMPAVELFCRDICLKHCFHKALFLCSFCLENLTHLTCHCYFAWWIPTHPLGLSSGITYSRNPLQTTEIYLELAYGRKKVGEGGNSFGHITRYIQARCLASGMVGSRSLDDTGFCHSLLLLGLLSPVLWFCSQADIPTVSESIITVTGQ